MNQLFFFKHAWLSFDDWVGWRYLGNTQTPLSLYWKPYPLTHLTWDKIMLLHTKKCAFRLLQKLAGSYCSAEEERHLHSAVCFHVRSGWEMVLYPASPKTIRKGALPRIIHQFSVDTDLLWSHRWYRLFFFSNCFIWHDLHLYGSPLFCTVDLTSSFHCNKH